MHAQWKQCSAILAEQTWELWKKQKAKTKGVLEKDKEHMRKQTEKEKTGRYMEEGNICVGMVEPW